MKKTTLFLITLAWTFAASAQKAMTAAEQERAIADITKAAQATQTLQCDFVQTKTLSILNDKMVSHGTMAFARPSKLRWNYTTPYDYTFIITDDKVLIGKGKQRNSIDLKSSQVFQEIARMIAGSITGKCLTQTKDFAVSMQSDANNYIALLTPKDKRVKKMFKSIRLTFDRKASAMSMVELTELSSDVTTITFQNVKQNQPLGATTFTLD